MIEQAKGILMERHKINEDRAFEMIRSHSQHSGSKLINLAEAIVESYLLLPPPPPKPPEISPVTEFSNSRTVTVGVLAASGGAAKPSPTAPTVNQVCDEDTETSHIVTT